MGAGTVLSALFMVIREDAHILANAWYRVPEMLAVGPTGPSMGFGVGWSLLSLGSGMLVGLRVNLSMLIGTVISWYFAPGLLLKYGVVDALVRKKVLLWIMWPATGMLIAGGLTALFMRWSILVRTFKNLSSAKVDSGDFPMNWVIAGSVISGAALMLVQKLFLGIPVWMTFVAILFSVPLMLVGLRVLGETNWGPISALSNMMQAVFGVLAPGNIAANMVASGVTGSIASESEGLMQDFKTGEMIGSTPRFLTYAQLMAVPVGAAAVSYVYPLLRKTYGIGGEHGLQSPISQVVRLRPLAAVEGALALRGALVALEGGLRAGRRLHPARGDALQESGPLLRPGWASACWCPPARSSRCSDAVVDMV